MITVIIPTRERPHWIGRCLENLDGADEIIVSDDSDTDSTRELVTKEFPAARWIKGPKRGPAANRNFAASQATGDQLAFIDDDCIPAKQWVSKVRSGLSASGLIEGRTICPDKTGGVFEEGVENDSGGVLWSCNFGIRRDLFLELGGFDEDFAEAGGEDLEFAWRVKQLNVPIVFVPEAIVYHPARQLSIRRWIYRIFQDRWHLLFCLKTTRTSCAVIDECKDLIRITARLAFRLGRKEAWSRALSILMRWFFFPLWFSYLLKWELLFRCQLGVKGDWKAYESTDSP